MREYATELIWVFGLLAAVVGTAALVNRYRPAQRARIRRLVTLWALFATATGAGIGFHTADLPRWSDGLFLAAEIFQAFTLVSLVATFAFAVMLPAIGIVLPMIASDLLVGLGYIVVAIGVMSEHGVNPTGALVSGAVVSAVLAISLQSTLGNILGGVALQLDGSIREGDWIQLENGKQGQVRSVRWRHTVVETRDWATIIVPNASLLGGNITILGKRDGVTVPQRLWVWFNVDFRFTPSRVIEVVTEAMQRSPIENVAEDPKPNVVCMDLTKELRESYATYAVRYWIKDLASDDPTSSRVRARVFAALQRAGIPLAVPAATTFVETKDAERTAKRDARKANERFIALKTVHLFRSLTDDELHQLADGMSHVIYAPGEVITQQGAVAHWLYVMTAGTAEIYARSDTTTNSRPPESLVKVAKITAPDFFGEMSLMTGEPRSADVIAASDVDCFRLGRDTFKTVLLARPEIATELSEKLARRRVELMAAREGLDASAMRDREMSERARILGGIKSFFALS